MATNIKLKKELKKIRDINPKLMSYNIEMTEVTGGTFWKAYSQAQVEGKEVFPPIKGFHEMAGIMQVYPPINLYGAKVRKLSKAFGPVWVRVSGTWATKTYYDFDGHTNGVIPDGYQSILTKEQWTNLLDFVKAVDAKLLVSVANCEGLHSANEPWNPSQAEVLFKYSKDYGVPIDAAEFMNEPNMLAFSGAPKGYTAANYRRDQDLFFAWVKKNYPEVLTVGPCTVAMEAANQGDFNAGGIVSMMGDNCNTDDLMNGTVEPINVFSYHYYNGISDRLASVMPSMHWSPDNTLSEAYLGVAPHSARSVLPFRDKYCPNGEIWVTESGDAGGGGNSWAPTFMDVFRTLNELGTYATITDGVIFHNTLASSAYGFLDHETFDPRPNYFAVLLWTMLMGNEVYDSEIAISEGAHIFAHSRKDGKVGYAYLAINNSKEDSTILEFEGDAEVYLLSASHIRSLTMHLNGKELKLDENNNLPDLKPVVVNSRLELSKETIAFIIL